MSNEETKPKAKYAKGEWEAELKKRAKALYESVTQVGNVGDDAIGEIFQELKDVGLQSYKNGCAAGAYWVKQKQKAAA